MGPEVRLRPNSPILCVLERPRAVLCRGAEARWVRAAPRVAPVASTRGRGVGAGVQMYTALGLFSPCPARSGVTCQ